MNQAAPGIGVGAYILRGGRVLMGYRTTGHAHGVWAPPGGHIELGESPAQTASREVLEETGLHIPPDTWTLRAITNDYFPQNHTHYFTFALTAKCNEGEPKVCEPHKLREWQWFEPNSLPSTLMASVENALKAGLDLSVKSAPILTQLDLE